MEDMDIDVSELQRIPRLEAEYVSQVRTVIICSAGKGCVVRARILSFNFDQFHFPPLATESNLSDDPEIVHIARSVSSSLVDILFGIFEHLYSPLGQAYEYSGD